MGARMPRQGRALLLDGSAWNAGSTTRRMLSGWNPTQYSADAATLPNLDRIRNRSRDLERNSAIGRGAIQRRTTKTIGTGLALSPQPEYEVLGWTREQAAVWSRDVLTRYRAWFETPACDAAARVNGYALQSLAFRGAMAAGDAFAVLPRLDDGRGRKRLAIQLIDAERVSNPQGKADTPSMAGGIEMDTYGQPLRVHIANRDPNSIYQTKREWTSVAVYGERMRRRNVVHVCPMERPLQTRGVPMLAPVIEEINTITRATNAEISAALIAGMLGLFITSEAGEADMPDLSPDSEASGADPSSGGWDMSVAADGVKAIGLAPGESVSSVTPGRPNSSFDPFVQAILGHVGMAVEIPYEVLAMRFQSSYSAARAALLEAWQSIWYWREWFGAQFCDPIYQTWLAHEIADGRISAPGYFDDPVLRWAYSHARWVGDGPGSIDPLKEINAAEKRILLGVSTREKESLLHDGGDWRRNVEQLVVEEEAMREIRPAAPVVPQPGAEQPSNDPPQDPEDSADE